MMTRRRRFTADFKKRVALEAKHEVHPNQVSMSVPCRRHSENARRRVIWDVPSSLHRPMTVDAGFGITPSA